MNWLCRNKIIIFFLFAYSISSTTVAQPLSTPVQLISGQYSISDAPLIAVSYDNGNSWSKIDLPQGIRMYDIQSIQCRSNFCAAVGSSYQPAFLVSNNKGYNWSYTDRIFQAPKNWPSTTRLQNINCSDSNCIALGTNEPNFPPLIVEGINQGQFWVAKSVTNLPSDYSGGSLISSSCINKFCIAVGRYSGAHPLILMSQNHGSTWSFVSVTGLPSKFKNVVLKDTACTGNSCIAVGYHDEGVLIIASHDRGTTWSYVKTLKNWPFKLTELDSVSCTGSICIAFGRYDKFGPSKILLLRSEDSGKTWYFLNPASKATRYLYPYEVRCDTSNCVAVAQAYHDGKSFPVIFVSNDYGQTWTNRVDYVSNLPPGTTGILPSRVSIRGNTAIVIGSYTVNYYHPLLLVSQNGGKTWEYKPIKGFPNVCGEHKAVCMG